MMEIDPSRYPGYDGADGTPDFTAHDSHVDESDPECADCQEAPEPTTMVAFCRCGGRAYPTNEAARAAEPHGSFKCPTCHTFAKDHEWRGDFSDPGDAFNPRCWDCDVRLGSHGGPR